MVVQTHQVGERVFHRELSARHISIYTSDTTARALRDHGMVLRSFYLLQADEVGETVQDHDAFPAKAESQTGQGQRKVAPPSGRG